MRAIRVDADRMFRRALELDGEAAPDERLIRTQRAEIHAERGRMVEEEVADFRGLVLDPGEIPVNTPRCSNLGAFWRSWPDGARGVASPGEREAYARLPAAPLRSPRELFRGSMHRSQMQGAGIRPPTCRGSDPRSRARIANPEEAMAQTETQTVSGTLNGVNVDDLVETIEAVEDDASVAQFRFRAHTEWIEGARSRTRIRTFEHAGEEDTSRDRPYVLQGDEPPVLLGDDSAPNAVETVLHALASCLSVGFVYNAAAEGVRVDSLDFDLEGDLDLRGFLGLDDDVRPGYSDIRVTYRVEADAPREKIEELCEYTQATSPVVDLLRNPVNVQVSMA